MPLVAVPSAFASSQRSLPFALYDVRGQLLLGAGVPVTGGVRQRMAEGQAVYGEADDVSPWADYIRLAVRRAARPTGGASSSGGVMPQPVRLAGIQMGTADTMVSGNAPVVINARGVIDKPDGKIEGSVIDQVHAAASGLSGALRDSANSPAGSGADWLPRTLDSLEQLRRVARRQPDATIYLLMQHCLHSTSAYSAHHGLLSALLVKRVARHLGWPEEEVTVLMRAAVTMNVGMARLQDQLAQQAGPLLPEQRRIIDDHPDAGAELLRSAGVGDALWLDIVRLHHAPDLAQRRNESAATRLAYLLQMVDRYSAKMSSRKGRAPMTALAAARDTCLPENGRPDAIAAALFKALGLYPPGTYVKLASGEVGVVIGQGARADQPRVAVLVGASGLPLTDPMARDTSQPGRQVAAPLTAEAVKVRLPALKVLALA
ncbi:MAG: hypothetical protein RL722_2011 [Pseudomonadota bacterium]|jgi:hypothetical protein